MLATLYTIGYQQRSLEEYIAVLRGAGIDVLVDVRETAWSHKPGFSKSAFQSALEEAGIEYIHAPFAGNPAWLRHGADTHTECLEWYDWYVGEFSEVIDALEDLVGQIHAEGKSAALTCFERHSGDCHRGILAERWAARGIGRTVEHLATDGCPRMVPA